MHPLKSIVVIFLCLLQLSNAANFSNPLKARDGSDPFIVWDSGYYYLLTTTWTDVEITRATTLEGLKRGEVGVIWTDTNPSRCCNVWAPELHKVNGTWYVYYTAGNRQNLDGQRSHVLKGGPTPFSPYTYATQLTPQWSIDGTLHTLSSNLYFIWSCFPQPKLQSLCIAPLSTPTSLASMSQTHILSTPTLPWERVCNPVNEGAAPLYRNNKTFIAYSASDCWTDSYQLGLLTYDGTGDPLLASSLTKTGPVFSSANGNYWTGHNAFFSSPDGKEVWNFGRAEVVGTVMGGPSGE
ncbi:hypothetical protein QBC34DRAFT_453376 [Podospora aff. communis PSN243]|uniref:Glycoside Hydrolase Family 43 n=1 Tax=Podospora aff. communis PSN243 TaxID=3040156 RepID=A0AAV9FZ02_9PEZI|nr:hypothetical protein QBC34DRAFT_453376 [Podospora aff. communis PSN243]